MCEAFGGSCRFIPIALENHIEKYVRSNPQVTRADLQSRLEYGIAGHLVQRVLASSNESDQGHGNDDTLTAEDMALAEHLFAEVERLLKLLKVPVAGGR